MGQLNVIRIRILQRPPVAGIDGIQFDRFKVGEEYNVGTTIASLFLAEGWAEPIPLDAPELPTPFTSDDPFDQRNLYRFGSHNFPEWLQRAEAKPPPLAVAHHLVVRPRERRKTAVKSSKH